MADSPLLENANKAIRNLSSRFGVAPFPPHITIPSSFSTFSAAEAAARAVAPLFRGADGLKLTLRLGMLKHEAERFRCVTAAAAPSKFFGDATMAAEKVKREMQGGSPTSIQHAPHMSLLYAELSAAERGEAMDVASAMERLAGETFEAGSIAIVDVTARPDYTQWAKLEEFPV